MYKSLNGTSVVEPGVKLVYRFVDFCFDLVGGKPQGIDKNLEVLEHITYLITGGKRCQTEVVEDLTSDLDLPFPPDLILVHHHLKRLNEFLVLFDRFGNGLKPLNEHAYVPLVTNKMNMSMLYQALAFCVALGKDMLVRRKSVYGAR
jgi:hypothetical protein